MSRTRAGIPAAASPLSSAHPTPGVPMFAKTKTPAKAIASTGRTYGEPLAPLRPFPAIGIRPTIDGRRDGVRESLEGQVLAMAQSAAELISTKLQYPDGSPVRCVIADTCIERRRRGRGLRAQVRRRRRRRLADRDPVLVLRLGDHGPRPDHAQGGVGLQRHRAPGRGLSRRGARGPRPEGRAGLRHLRPGRAGRRRHRDPRPTSKPSCCASRAPVWRWR